MSLIIRKVEENDIEDFTRIKALAYADDRKKTIVEEKDKPKWYDGEWYVGLGIPNIDENRRLMKEFECYMICLDDIPIGIFWLHVEEEASLTLEDFCILPDYQGKGYGTEGLYLIEKSFSDNRRWMLSTPCFCKRNCHLYEKVGYKVIGYASDNTVVLYEKVL